MTIHIERETDTEQIERCDHDGTTDGADVRARSPRFGYSCKEAVSSSCSSRRPNPGERRLRTLRTRASGTRTVRSGITASARRLLR